MKWQGRRGSRNIEDRRRMGGGKAIGGGGIGLIAIVLIGYLLGFDVTPLLQGVQNGGISSGGSAEITAEDERAAQFVSVVLADTEEVWTGVFDAQVDGPYTPPTLVLFKGVTQSPCGGASGATGPFYCPSDQKAYLDTDFFMTMSRQLGAEGDLPKPMWWHMKSPTTSRISLAYWGRPIRCALRYRRRKATPSPFG